MRCCQPLRVSKNYPWCLNLISECSAGTSNLWIHHFWKSYTEWDAHLQRGQAKHWCLRRARSQGTVGSLSSLSVPLPRHTVQHRLSVWKAPPPKTKLCFPASRPQLLNCYFKKATRLEFRQCGEKVLKSICSPAFWELTKISPALGRENFSIFCSSVCTYLLLAFALWFACGGSLQESARNLAGEKAVQELLPCHPVKTRLSREYLEAAYFILQIHQK